jgi:hypothetical protein
MPGETAPRGERPQGERPGRVDGSTSQEDRPKPGDPILPGFFFPGPAHPTFPVSRSEFDSIVRGVFTKLDKNGDGSLSGDEVRPPRQPGVPPTPAAPPMPPNARFVGAEMRFGDKLVAGQPFSADIVIEDTRRLFDGSTVMKQSKGAVYRDGVGRTRREQPLQPIGGVNLVGKDEKPQTLVFISDFASRTQIFLDPNNKVARKERLDGERRPREAGDPEDAKSESLGTKAIEGVKVEGTRLSFEIPAGEIGNDKPMQVITERWFSPELQVLVYSKHIDPIAGEHIFRLINIKRGEPSAELFTIPTGYRVEAAPAVRPRE